MERIAIIGLGLIGGSIGLALKKAGLSDIEIAGTARSRDTIRRARKIGAIDVEAMTPEEAATGARLVIVASPILTIPAVFDEIAPVLAPGAIVTDVASTSGAVARWAKEKLPEGVHFIGGHPMAGKETQGIDAADADLFQGRTWVISPSVDAPESAVDTIIGLAQQLGAKPVFMDAEEHDSYVAAISHLPLTMASALFSVAFGSAAWPELAQLAAGGFRDSTRLASGSPEMAHDIMKTNRDNVIHWLDRLQIELTRFREIIARGDEKELAEAFAKAQVERDNFMLNGAPQRDVQEQFETISLGDMLMGTKVNAMLKKQNEIIRASEARANKKR